MTHLPSHFSSTSTTSPSDKKEMKGELEKGKMGPDSREGPPKDKTSIEEVVNRITEKPTAQYFFMLLGLMSFNLVRIRPN